MRLRRQSTLAHQEPTIIAHNVSILKWYVNCDLQRKYDLESRSTVIEIKMNR